MSDIKNEKEELTIFTMADQFIAVANKLVQGDKQDLGRVGAAFVMLRPGLTPMRHR